jgi:hypothetical protein
MKVDQTFIDFALAGDARRRHAADAGAKSATAAHRRSSSSSVL